MAFILEANFMQSHNHINLSLPPYFKPKLAG